MKNDGTINQEEMDKCDKLFNKWNEEYFKEKRRTFNHVYYELQMLQDIRIGALSILRLMHKKEDYEHFVDNLHLYNKRLSPTVAEHFPKIDITDEEINTFIKDPKNMKALLLVSPMTSLFNELPRFNIEFMNLNKKAKSLGAEDMSVVYTINTYPLDITKDRELQLLLKSRMKHIDPQIKLAIICRETQHVPKDIYLESNILGIYDIESFFSEQCSVFSEVFRENKFTKKILYIPEFVINDEVNLDEYTPEQISRSREISEQYLSMATMFSVVRTPRLVFEKVMR